jgi:signal peptidase I
VDTRLLLGVFLTAAALLPGCSDEGHGTIHRHFRIPSPAMEPTIKAGAIVDADLGAYMHQLPQRGDIVIFFPPLGASNQQCGIPSEPTDGRPCERATPARDPKVKFIKRIAGLPGDWLYVQNNRTYIGRQRGGPYVQQREPFIAKATPCDELCNLRKPIRIPPGHYFVLGDNRGQSDDSRDWGPVPFSSIIGEVATG